MTTANAALITVLLIDRPMCLAYIGAKTGVSTPEVDQDLTHIARALHVRRDEGERCRTCGETATVFSFERATTDLKVAVERLLVQTPGEALCDACLALATGSSLSETRLVTDALALVNASLKRGVARCETCRREVLVTVFRPSG
jgi:hypothetical protein